MAAPATCLGSRRCRAQARSRKCSTSSGDVVAPLAEGGHAQGHDVEAVVQVLAELALGDQLVDVPVGRGHEPDVERDQLLAAEPAHLALLEHAEQVDLGLGGHLADLVEEQRAALRHLEPAGLLPQRRR